MDILTLFAVCSLIKIFDYSKIIKNQAKTQEFEIINETAKPVTINSIAINGANRENFKIEKGDPNGGTIPSMSKTVLSITYSPGSMGNHHANVKIDSNIGNYTIQLTSKTIQNTVK